MHVLVVTVVHHPEDARILHRQIAALIAHGHTVTYAAPFTARATPPRPGVEGVDLPRATGRDRRAAVREARRLLARRGPAVDAVVLHDPELLLTLPRTLRHWHRTGARRPAVVWDVHEDTAAALAMKGWVPRPLRPPLRLVVRAAELAAERHLHLLLAEYAYQGRFRRTHPVVPNLVTVPEAPPPAPGGERVVYLGQISRARGAEELVAMARLLAPDVRVELIGAADGDVRALLAAADRDGVLRWHGFLPNDAALDRLRGALAGVSLLRDEANYRHSRPTKVVEYMAYGIPVVSTPNPLAAELVRGHDCGLLVPFRAPAAAADAVRRLRDDPELRRAMGARGHATARSALHWPDCAALFVTSLEGWAAAATAAGERPPAGRPS
ncbi:glycosyltransferase [Actinacidiphila glaucinigra]|uniref:D-inositol 3-phosphate glycosyltransferase n=1 Tax=Actinacidiphila glaucinigra TaxID=235986 RepID=A0A239N3L6_9ACTN|nr:glycosyltransferase [Actinacidiphila glaucinigra]SNT49053.1 Glycosyltransferase involved in cell wall bisynthesis [Actinacidiphila glaucinigra]